MYLACILKYDMSSEKTVYFTISLEPFVNKYYEKCDLGSRVCNGINDGERPKSRASMLAMSLENMQR